jgi:uncharacterized protein
MNAVPFNAAGVSFVSLATFRRNGLEVRTPVWFVELSGKFYCFSAGRAGKVKRIRNNGRARLAACTMRGDVRSEWADATARIVDDAALIADVYQALRRKYGWQMAITDFLARLTGRYQRRAVVEIDMAARH